MKKETIDAIKKILSSIQKQGLKTGQGMGSVDSGTVNTVSLNLVDTQVLSHAESISYLLTNPEGGVLSLCVERPLHAVLAPKKLSLEEIQTRIQSSVLFVIATKDKIGNLTDDLEDVQLNMALRGVCEVNYKPGISLNPDIVLAPTHLVNSCMEAGFKNVYSTPMTTMPVEQLQLDMSLMDSRGYSGKLIQVPDYGKALKAIFSAEKVTIYLHTTRLPCDFDYSPTVSVAPKITPTPTSILQTHAFKVHPKGDGTVYYKNYASASEPSAHSARSSDAALLNQFGLFTLKEAVTGKNQLLSLVATINQSTTSVPEAAAL